MMEAKPVLFHSKGHPFSNFYPIKFVDTIVIQGDKEKITFRSVEHYLQACKAVLFQDFGKFRAILKCVISPPVHFHFLLIFCFPCMTPK